MVFILLHPSELFPSLLSLCSLREHYMKVKMRWIRLQKGSQNEKYYEGEALLSRKRGIIRYISF